MVKKKVRTTSIWDYFYKIICQFMYRVDNANGLSKYYINYFRFQYFRNIILVFEMHQFVLVLVFEMHH